MSVIQAIAASAFSFAPLLPCDHETPTNAAIEIFKTAEAENAGKFAELVDENIEWSVTIADTSVGGSERERVVKKFGSPRNQLMMWMAKSDFDHALKHSGAMICTNGNLSLELVSVNAHVQFEFEFTDQKLTKLTGMWSRVERIDLKNE